LTGQSDDSKRELLRRLLHERMAKPPEPRGDKSLSASSPIEIGAPLERVPRTDDLELSFGQEMIWLQDQMIPEVMFYNVVERFGVKGRLDVELLRRCIDEVTKRHEILRTIYPIIAGRPVQRVEPPHPCSLRVFDLRKCTAQDREREARRLIVANVKTRFDLERDAVLRPMLLQLGDEEFIFAVVIHHIAIDGWSLRLFIHEIASFYSAFLDGRKPELHRITVQYVDFARWQRRWMTGDVLARHRDYWRDKLGTSPPLLNLRSDFTPGPIRTFDSSVFHVAINSDALARLKEISRRAGATLFAVLLGAFATLLMRYSGQEDFIIGSIMSARVRPEVDELLGFFGNLLALRADLSGNPTFNELVFRMREIVFDAHEHGAYPFQQLVEVMQPKRSVNSNPFVRVLLNMLNLWDREEVSLPNLSIRPLGGLDVHMPTDVLMLFASESSQQLILSFFYSTELFKPSTIERMAKDMHSLLESASVSSQTRIWDLPMAAQQIEAPKDAVAGILAELGASGIRLSVDDGRLKVNAPKGALNDALKTAIASHREEIIARLRTARSQGSEHWKLHHVARRPPLPLTAVQKRFWFLDRIGQGQSVPNVNLPLRLKGPIDFDAMMAAITTVLARHETLRLRIGDRDGEPYPEIWAAPEDLVTVVDLTTQPDAERDRHGDRLSKELMLEAFDLVTGPLAKVLFVRLSPTDNLITFSMHHIVADGWSSSILLRELGAVYSAATKASKPDLLPLPYQYVDYAAWEAAQVHNGLFERQLNYWRERLAGVPPLLDLPTDRRRPKQRSFRGNRMDCTIETDVVLRLQQFSKSHDATLFMTVLAAFGVVLHRLTGQDEIVIGTPVANRGSPELEQVVGPFVNSLSLRLSVAGNPSFASYLSQVRRATIEAIDNRDLPFDMVVEAINPARTLEHAPIYQVMFGLHNFPLQSPRFEGLECSFIKPETQVARLDLQLDMIVHEGQLVGAYEYALDLFDDTTIERIHALLIEVLNGVLADEGKSVRDLPMRSAAQDHLLLDLWNNTQHDHDRGVCLHHLFERVAAQRPGATAIVIGAEIFSYRDIDQRANRLAHLLRLRGVRLGDRVGLCLDRTIEMPVAIAAVLKVGAAYVPLDPAHPSDRLRYVIEDARVACVVTMSWLVELFVAAEIPCVLLDAAASELEGFETSPPAVTVAPDDVAYVIYTSGSTGRPKGVQVEHRNVVSFLDAMRREPGLNESDVLLAVTTLSFDIAGLEIWLPLSVGAKVVLASKADVAIGDRLIDLIDRHQVTVMQATPSTWRLLLDAGWTGKSDMKVLCGGEAMQVDLAAILLTRVAQLWNMYGPTETTIWSTTGRVLEAAGVPSIGKPIANTRVYVLEPGGTLAALGGFGELAIGGEGVARGYWNRPELTAEKFVNISLPGGRTERVFRTGDIVRFRNDGQLEFHGRRDGQIKLRGYRIELGEIEAILATCQAVKEATVVVREDEPGDRRLVAYVVARVGEPFDLDAARTVLKTALPGYMIPAEFVVLAAMPLTPNGKVNRAALPVPQRGSNTVSQVQSEVVMTSTQKRVADLWAEVLGTDRISLHDNFFDVGGYSMLAVKLHAALKREFESGMTLTELFQHTTVAAQAARVTLPVDGNVALRRAEARARKRLHG
jgi:amino acid adenylation domain-containing protein